jgi:ABC-type protease/lipase transport system fused ATPase/permease subunit
MGRDADSAALTQAAVASGADAVIEKLPHGYDADLLAFGGQYAELFTLRASQYEL